MKTKIAARQMDVTEATVRRLIKRRILKAVKTNKVWDIDEESVKQRAHRLAVLKRLRLYNDKIFCDDYHCDSYIMGGGKSALKFYNGNLREWYDEESGKVRYLVHAVCARCSFGFRVFDSEDKGNAWNNVLEDMIDPAANICKLGDLKRGDWFFVDNMCCCVQTRKRENGISGKSFVGVEHVEYEKGYDCWGACDTDVLFIKDVQEELEKKYKWIIQ
jgi:hypothetical protein